MELPLKNVRITDITQVGAGPMAMSIFAHFGAEVIHVESLRRLDPSRISGGRLEGAASPGERPWNRSAGFNYTNVNKLGITLDLTTDDGRNLFKALIKISDAVAENFRPGVMERFGLGYEELREINPAIIMLSMPIFGSTGPESGYRGYGLGVEMISGMVNLTGYQGGHPMKSGIHHGDAVEAAHGASALLAALWYRSKTGTGQHIDCASNEANLCIIGEYILDFAMNGQERPRMGNRHHSMAPHGCYRCQGEDKWVTIAIASDREWQQFCGAIGHPDLAVDARFSTIVARKRNEDALDEIVSEWTAGFDPHTVTEILQVAGIAAGPVLDIREILDNPHLKERGFFQKVNHPEVGEVTCDLVRAKLSKTPGRVRIPAPCLGEHNKYVFQELLGLSDQEFAHLEEKGIIGSVPLGQRASK
ncbi:CaiB/BaiF CoA transferase family protein [Chloroflexota bacterium]